MAFFKQYGKVNEQIKVEFAYVRVAHEQATLEPFIPWSKKRFRASSLVRFLLSNTELSKNPESFRSGFVTREFFPICARCTSRS
jgi:hypothetical protein